MHTLYNILQWLFMILCISTGVVFFIIIEFLVILYHEYFHHNKDNASGERTCSEANSPPTRRGR